MGAGSKNSGVNSDLMTNIIQRMGQIVGGWTPGFRRTDHHQYDYFELMCTWSCTEAGQHIGPVPNWNYT